MGHFWEWKAVELIIIDKTTDYTKMFPSQPSYVDTFEERADCRDCGVGDQQGGNPRLAGGKILQ